MQADYTEMDNASEHTDKGPEYHLVVSCFRQAITDAVMKYDCDDKATALRWIESDSTGPFSFLWCCDAIDLDPDKVRSAMKERAAAIFRQVGAANRQKEKGRDRDRATHIKAMLECADKGISPSAYAASQGFSRGTFKTWAARYSDFKTAYAKAQALYRLRESESRLATL